MNTAFAGGVALPVHVGPASRTAAAARMRQMASYDNLLPIPTVHFDAKANAVTMDNQSVQDYVNKLFAPLSPSHLMTDFPGFLRRAADTLAAVKK